MRMKTKLKWTEVAATHLAKRSGCLVCGGWSSDLVLSVLRQSRAVASLHLALFWSQSKLV